MPQTEGLPFVVGLLTLLEKALNSGLFDLPPLLRRVLGSVLETERQVQAESKMDIEDCNGRSYLSGMPSCAFYL
ncbi:hypothetical protein PAL_GLEAN10004807 [Pteropus alecto]|uniref:Uncharacterized protein n=1 Tax=Pteropus alecto TaxID=9402 RepID=L5KWA0_PTEAL|nr:hypothetical protein PAL_GLEAN10004807 [Pteropus alecto]